MDTIVIDLSANDESCPTFNLECGPSLNPEIEPKIVEERLIEEIDGTLYDFIVTRIETRKRIRGDTRVESEQESLSATESLSEKTVRTLVWEPPLDMCRMDSLACYNDSDGEYRPKRPRNLFQE